MLGFIDNFDKETVLTLNGYFSVHLSIFLNKLFSEYLIYLLPVLLVVLWFWNQKSKKIALRASFSVILAWPIIANVLGRIINRPRPFEVENVIEIIFHRPSYSFPSDHASALFAVGASFWFSGYKKLSIVTFSISLIICFFRISSGIHFPSDILGGIFIGVLSAYVIKCCDKYLNNIYDFFIKTAKIIKLA